MQVLLNSHSTHELGQRELTPLLRFREALLRFSPTLSHSMAITITKSNKCLLSYYIGFIFWIELLDFFFFDKLSHI